MGVQRAGVAELHGDGQGLAFGARGGIVRPDFRSHIRDIDDDFVRLGGQSALRVGDEQAQTILAIVSRREAEVSRVP